MGGVDEEAEQQVPSVRADGDFVLVAPPRYHRVRRRMRRTRPRLGSRTAEHACRFPCRGPNWLSRRWHAASTQWRKPFQPMFKETAPTLRWLLRIFTFQYAPAK